MDNVYNLINGTDCQFELGEVNNLSDLKANLESLYSLFTDECQKVINNFSLELIGAALVRQGEDIPIDEDRYFKRTRWWRKEGDVFCLRVRLPGEMLLDEPLSADDCDIRCVASDICLYGRDVAVKQMDDRTYVLVASFDFDRVGQGGVKEMTLMFGFCKGGITYCSFQDIELWCGKELQIPETENFLVFVRDDEEPISCRSVDPETDDAQWAWRGRLAKSDFSTFLGMEFTIGIYRSETGQRVDGYVLRAQKVEGQKGEWGMDREIELEFLQEGQYTIRVFYTGQLLLTTAFNVGERIPGQIRYKRSEKETVVLGPEKSAVEQLMAMVGLESVKKVIGQNMDYARLLQARQSMGLPCPTRLMNVVMTGTPGTGKTTVARLYGGILHSMGLLSKGQLVECNRESLTDMWIGSSEKRTKELIDEAKGGVLFIDEAYSLFVPDRNSKDYGKRVIDTLMTVLSDPNADVVVVMAGYPKEMAKLLQMNPGLASRFPVRMDFQDYTVDEMLQIVQLYCREYNFTMTEEAVTAMKTIVSQAVQIKNNGNGRFIHNLMNLFVIPNMGDRVSGFIDSGTVTEEQLSVITEEDIPSPEEVFRKFGMKTAERKLKIGFRS